MSGPMRLAASMIALYLLPHGYAVGQGLLVGIAFALIVIGSSEVVFSRSHLLRYASYLLISVGTYRILFENQPWEALSRFVPWEVDSFIVCSVVMSFAGWLLLPRGRGRALYLLVTLPVQIPVWVFYKHPAVQSALTASARLFHYADPHTGKAQMQQFFWLVNYYLPVYLMSRRVERS